MRTSVLVSALASAALSACSTTPATHPTANPTTMTETVRMLSSKPFEGRAPGTPGEAKTVDYLVKRFKALGLQPGGPDGAWTQQVPMIRTQIGSGTIAVDDKGKAIALTQGKDIDLTTVRPDSTIKIADAPLVFVGYGVSAPEAKWDDFKGVDLHGKVAVFLVNDPDFKAVAGEDAYGKFGGNRETYYGRWTYKFEEAARRGAAAALIVHDTDAAGYGWSTVSASQGENYALAQTAGAAQPIPLQGWLQHDVANRLFAAAGLDLDTLRKQARSADFHPVPLTGLAFHVDLPVTVEHIESRNVLARLPGKTHPDETVIFSAHWDAYGEGKPDAQGRTMRPGANDDGLGDAGVLELARMFKATPQTDRSLLFALWTGEERGLLGSKYYAEHPVYPLARTVADMTIDILQTAGPARNVVEVGKGNSTLDQYLEAAAKAQGRTVVPETFTERGLFFRADHFSLVRQGVPSLLLMALGGAPDLKQGGLKAGQAWLDGYMKCYHQTCDTLDPDWDLRGAAQDVDLFYDVGLKLADSRAWPTWSDDSVFKRIRQQSAAERQ